MSEEKIYFNRDDNLVLRLGLGMGEIRAFSSHDQALVKEINEAIKKAIQDKQ